MAQTFKSAFAAARKAQGAGAVFSWNGKSYSTNYAEESKAPAAPKVTRPKARPAANAAAPKVTTPSVSPRPRTAVSGVANAKPKVDTVARDMLNNNIAKATGDKLAADRAKPAVKMPARPVSKTPVAKAPVTKTPVKKTGAAAGGYSDRNPIYVPGPKTTFKTPNRATVAPKPTGKPATAPKTAAVLKALKGIFTGQGGLGDRKRTVAAPKKKSNAR